MIGVIDLQMGNIRSVCNSLALIGEDYIVIKNSEEVKTVDKLILPGVGSFGEASKRLKKSGFYKTILEHVEKKKAILGICLGMQLLFDQGEEGGNSPGLGLIKGRVLPLNNRINTLAIPHVGWNDLLVKDSKLLRNVSTGDCVYFVHSFEVITEDDFVVATTNYDVNITAAVQKENVYGVQFHPEKSQRHGIQILKNFVRLC